MIKSYTGNINVKSNWILDFTLSNGVPLTVTLNLGMVPKGLNRNTLFLVFLHGIFDFLWKTAILGFRTDRTLSTVRTQLYLSCS